MKKIVTITFLIVTLLTGYTYCQTNTDVNYAVGEIMVQLDDNAELTTLTDGYGLKVKHIVSERFNIYLLEFDNAKSSNSSMITTLSKNKLVLNVQNNHSVTLRDSDETLPNDSLFDNQWSLYNTGQGSATAGADIDARYAWDITTGGLTVLGDTIVVAIIDGGSDLDHEDLNFWKNHSEIPNNNIDDDNNGYVDDYDGWNAYNHTGEIPDNVHGVHVCGTAGAIGNNGVGVSGVNWNVKTLPIAGESSYESIVVEALSYVYVVRERYDQTNGAEGAFVVAQNNSFGVDKGQPSDYPIWEAMYDSLGSLGVLSMGATANKPWDIDSIGDVPTAFTTDYLISVTNTTNRDLKNAGAGYGSTTIDLGAPGTMIWSLGLNNTYRNSTGTSMATPHVTGAAALLFSAADSAFIAEYKNNPSQGALMIKEYLLNGVDILSDLEGRTVSGGRLNIFNSINLMLSAPGLQTNIDSISIEGPLGYIRDEILIITNSGGDTLDYVLNIEDQPQWILLSKDQGELLSGESDTIIVSLSSEGLDFGNYECVIDISGSKFDSRQLPVKMGVYDDTGINSTRFVNDFKVYPNPFNNKVEFGFNSVVSGEAVLEIYDITGRIVSSVRKEVFAGDVHFVWNNPMATGNVYFYQIYLNNDRILSGKLIKK